MVQVECTVISTEGADRTVVEGPGLWSISASVSISGIQFTNFPVTLFSLYCFTFNPYLFFTVNNITAYNNNLVVDFGSSNIYLNLYNSNFTSNTLIVTHDQSVGYNGAVTMENSTVVNGAGGINGYYDYISIINSTFTSMQCAYQGCALSLNRVESFLINQTTFSDCVSSTDGGAIWLSSLPEGGIIISTVFLQNTAVNGGAIYSYDSIEIIDSKFISNYASSVGGAFYLSGSVGGSVGATISYTDFEENTGATSAGAVYCENGIVYFQYVDFTQNYAPIGASYQCGSGCSTYVYEVNSSGNDPSCPSS